jgi:polyphosphate glucokinase
MTATDTPPASPSTNGSSRRGFGVDVGGSGVKGGIVDLETGALIGERFKLPTPQPSTPDAVAKTVAAVVREFGWTGSLGVTYPGVVTDGTVRTAANVDKGWIGTSARDVISAALDGQPVTVLNDADAAGLAEEKFGAGKDNTGVIVLLTFGTGIGSAVIHNGLLLPNTEFGHLEVGGKEAEHRAASSVKERKDWSYERWTQEVTTVLVAIENAIWPDLFIAGGGISRKAEKWIPLLKNRTPVVAASLLNTAGIVGAAMAADVDVTATERPTWAARREANRRSKRRLLTLSLQWSMAAA